tara:strand:+ start:498 stop:704 length:207 start_codon:yes stop_codon:yes gene_type:complete
VIKMKWEEILKEHEELVPELKEILKQWETKQYPSDKARWKEYHNDIQTLLARMISSTVKRRGPFTRED